jgi:hypothetical protein
MSGARRDAAAPVLRNDRGRARQHEQGLVDTKAGGNVLYLPLDKLTERRVPALTLDEQRQAPATPAARETPETPSTTVEARRERGAR